MNKKYGNLLILVFVAFLVSISCRFPFKIVRNLPETQTPTTSNTPIPMTITNSPAVQQPSTATPENTPIPVDVKPAKGSVLTWTDNSNFVYIPGGEFGIGKDSYDAADFAPFHRVALSGFWIQQAEVSNQQYAQCVSDGKCSPPIQDPRTPYWYENPLDGNHPVVGVTWFQAREYCLYIRSRLPTEAEWEAAARGTDSKAFPWGGDKPNCNYANFKGCLDPIVPYDIRSYSFGVSEFNLYDLSGNVFEWVADWYSNDYYSSSPEIDPAGPMDGRKRVYRGGSYQSTAEELASYLRFALEPEKQMSDLGFRCVLDGNPLTESGFQIGQPCSVAGMNDQAAKQSTATPFPCAEASVNGFCQLLSGKPSYGVEIRQSGCLENNLFSLTGNSEPMSCSITKLSDGGNKYQCTFPGMGQGIMVNVNYCNVLDVPLVERTCPVGYQLDNNSIDCVLKNSKLPTPPCPSGYKEISNYGCLPLLDSEISSCPIGFYAFESASGYVCMPLNKCLLPNSSESCTNTICAASQRFDNFNNCCDSGDSLKKVCPSNLNFDDEQNVCIEPELFSSNCRNTQAKIPLCPTLTPTPTATPLPPPDCSIFKDANSCLNNGCHWRIGFFTCY